MPVSDNHSNIPKEESVKADLKDGTDAVVSQCEGPETIQETLLSALESAGSKRDCEEII